MNKAFCCFETNNIMTMKRIKWLKPCVSLMKSFQLTLGRRSNYHDPDIRDDGCNYHLTGTAICTVQKPPLQIIYKPTEYYLKKNIVSCFYRVQSTSVLSQMPFSDWLRCSLSSNQLDYELVMSAPSSTITQRNRE